MVTDVTGPAGAKYFPYIFTVFLFVLFANLLALIPTSFSTTSHIAVTAILALTVFISVTAIGFVKHGPGFLKLFWVSSAPTVALRIVLAAIELISYFVRPLSHSVRLAGNMMAGHAVLKVFAGFAGALGVASVIPILAITAVYGLELLVAVIQAYVFAILTCVYLNDALHPGH
jgi:F-type H+-transporting ATPase subunit a